MRQVARSRQRGARALRSAASWSWFDWGHGRRRISLERYHGLSPALLCTAGFDGYFKLVNPAWTRLLGWDEGALLNQPFIELVHPDDREPTLRAMESLTNGTDVVNFQNRYRAADGTYCWLEWHSHADLAHRRIYAAARDISLQKQAETTVLRRSDALAHTLKNSAADAELEMLERLAVAAECRDDDTYQHTLRVGYTSEMLARAAGLSDRESALIGHAARLHDVGKLAISDTILLKPGKLTPEEFAVVKTHTTAGARILSGSSSTLVRLAEEIALTHHERWDATGYPTALGGEEIPVSGRIVAVADVFDALTHRRPYKQAWPVSDAVEEIRCQRMRQFGPRVVDAFLSLNHLELAHGAATPPGATRQPRAA
jgi:PAS domain S-box-containing protein